MCFPLIFKTRFRKFLKFPKSILALFYVGIKVLARDDKYIILPNTNLTKNPVINWTHSQVTSRFEVKVGVDYGFISYPILIFAQAPNLGTSANYVLFTTNGSVSNTGRRRKPKLSRH